MRPGASSGTATGNWFTARLRTLFETRYITHQQAQQSRSTCLQRTTRLFFAYGTMVVGCRPINFRKFFALFTGLRKTAIETMAEAWGSDLRLLSVPFASIMEK